MVDIQHDAIEAPVSSGRVVMEGIDMVRREVPEGSLNSA